jgi:hypothetical protein
MPWTCVQRAQFFMWTDRWHVGRWNPEKYSGRWTSARIVPSGGLWY